MHARTILAAGMTAAAVFATAAGGGSTGAAAGAGIALGAGATVAPSDTVAFVAIDSNLGSAQWQALDGLLATLSPNGGLVAKLQQSFEQKTGLSWAGDVQPALGPEVDVAVLPTPSDGKPQVVLLTQPADRSKLDALLPKLAPAGGQVPVSEQIGGWTAVSENRSALDAVSTASTRLAGESLYREASAKLPSEALLAAYANGGAAQQLVSALGGSTGSAGGHVVWAAADAVASGGGLKIDGFVRSDVSGPEPYASSLVDQIPSGALAVADFQASRPSDSASAPSSPLGSALAKLRGTLGGETAVYVSPGAPLPAVTLVTHPADPQAVLAGVSDALAALGSSLGSAKAGGLDLGALLGGLQLSHAQVGSALVVSTSQQAIDAFTGSGAKLADDASFQGARTVSGMPDETTGFVYANLGAALPAIQGLLSLAGGSSATGGGLDLGALQTVTAYGSGESGGVAEFTVFLAAQ
jgi:Protein of unknown function (DUF3352)